MAFMIQNELNDANLGFLKNIGFSSPLDLSTVDIAHLVDLRGNSILATLALLRAHPTVTGTGYWNLVNGATQNGTTYTLGHGASIVSSITWEGLSQSFHFNSTIQTPSGSAVLYGLTDQSILWALKVDTTGILTVSKTAGGVETVYYTATYNQTTATISLQYARPYFITLYLNGRVLYSNRNAPMTGATSAVMTNTGSTLTVYALDPTYALA